MPLDFFEGQRQINTWGGRIQQYLRSSVFKRTTASCFVLLIYIIVGRSIEDYIGRDLVFPADEVSLVGAALSLLMVLRTNSAYDRWWEGRKLWGALVNNCRNLALKVKNSVDVEGEEAARAQSLIVSFPYALMEHLRGGPTELSFNKIEEPVPSEVTHLPAHISGELFGLLRQWRDSGKVHKFDHHLIDQHLVSLLDICGACERIRNTPLPLAHRALIPQILILYLLVVPLGLALTPVNLLVTMAISYFLLGLELAAEDIEEPFGRDCHDLPLDQLCANIERSVREILRKVDGTEASECEETTEPKPDGSDSDS